MVDLPEKVRVTLWANEEHATGVADEVNSDWLPGQYRAVPLAYPLGTTGEEVTGWTIAMLPTRG
jgi:hypothetical protein